VDLVLGNPMRQIESRVGRALLYLLFYFVVVLLVALAIGVINSNLFWGEANQYGRIDIPGAGTVHLPGGTTEATVAVALPGRGNETPELLVPPLQLSVTPLGEAGKVTIDEALGSSVNANDKYDDTSRVLWKIHAPSAGDYRVKVAGDMTGYGVNSQLWLGYQPGWVHGSTIWFLAMAIVAAAAALFLLVPWLRRRRKAARDARPMGGWEEPGDPSVGSEGTGHAESFESAAQKMVKLQRAHERGRLGDAEFESKKADLERDFMSERGLG
jgi:hypothetical protein